MDILPTNEAIVRFDQNEDRINKFVNGLGTYTPNSGLPNVETLPSFMQRNSQALNLLTATNVKGDWAASTVYSVWDEVKYSGTWYRCVVAHTSSMTFDSTKWRLSQGVTLGQLGATSGAGLIGTADGQTLANKLVFDSVAALRANTATAASGLKVCEVTSYYGGNAVALQQPPFQGNYFIKTSDTTSADNGGTIIVDAAGNRWYLSNTNSVSLAQFGVKGYVESGWDDSIPLQNAVNWAGSANYSCLFGEPSSKLNIENTVIFTSFGTSHNPTQIDFRGAEITWTGSNSNPTSMFKLFGNKSLGAKNFTLICKSSAGINSNVNGIFADSIQPNGSDLLRFSSFYIKRANIAINLGSVGADQNRVSDCIFESYLLEGCNIGVQTNSTNVDSIQFINGQHSGTGYGFNLVRAGYIKIDTCIGYACDPFIVRGVCGNLLVINSQSEQGGLVNPAFFYTKNYTNAQECVVTFIGCTIDNKIFIDYDPLVGSSTFTLNIFGGYFREFASSCPDTVINLVGTHQTSGYNFSVSGINVKVNNLGSRLFGTKTDYSNALRVPVYADNSNNVALGAAAPQYTSSGRTVLYAEGTTSSMYALGVNGNRSGYLGASGSVVELCAEAGSQINFTIGSTLVARARSNGAFKFLPQTQPDNGEFGDVYMDSTSGKLRRCNASLTWVDIG